MKFLGILLLLGILSACGDKEPLEVFTTPVTLDRPEDRPNIPNPSPIRTEPVEWRVLTPNNLPPGDDWVYYGVLTKHYEALSRNTADILRWVKEARWRLDYYRGEGELDGAGNEGTSGRSDTD